MKSNTPPGGNGTTRRIGRDGYASADALRDAPASAAAPAARRRNALRDCGIGDVLPAVRDGRRFLPAVARIQTTAQIDRLPKAEWPPLSLRNLGSSAGGSPGTLPQSAGGRE